MYNVNKNLRLTRVFSSLAAVNFFMFCVGTVQTARILQYRSSLKHESLGAAAKEMVKEEGDNVKALVKDPKGSVKL